MPSVAACLDAPGENRRGGGSSAIFPSDRQASPIVVGRETRSYIVSMLPIDIVPAALSDQELLREVARRAASEREATAALVALLAEMDARRLHLTQGCSSLFTYCTERLHLSEHAAYHRIEAARAARQCPVILEHLASGQLTLTTVAMLRPHLTTENCEKLLQEALGRRKREVEILVRCMAPLPDVRASIRKISLVLPSPHASIGADDDSFEPASPRTPPVIQRVSSEDVATATSRAPNCVGSSEAGCADVLVRRSAELLTLAADAPAPARASRPASLEACPQRAEVRALSPVSYSLRVTLSVEAHAKLRKAQDLLRHQLPNGDPAVIVDRALTLLVEQLERAKFAKRKDDTGGTERTKPAKRKEKAHGRQLAGSATRNEKTQKAELAECATRKDDRPSHSTEGGGDGRRSRRIPAAVRRDVWERDQGRCAFVSAAGRCTETGRIEFHHRVPYADGGESSVANIEIRCTAHNQHEAERWQCVAPAWTELHGGARSDGGSRTRSGPSSRSQPVFAANDEDPECLAERQNKPPGHTSDGL